MWNRGTKANSRKERLLGDKLLAPEPEAPCRLGHRCLWSHFLSSLPDALRRASRWAITALFSSGSPAWAQPRLKAARGSHWATGDAWLWQRRWAWAWGAVGRKARRAACSQLPRGAGRRHSRGWGRREAARAGGALVPYSAPSGSGAARAAVAPAGRAKETAVAAASPRAFPHVEQRLLRDGGRSVLSYLTLVSPDRWGFDERFWHNTYFNVRFSFLRRRFVGKRLARRGVENNHVCKRKLPLERAQRIAKIGTDH